MPRRKVEKPEPNAWDRLPGEPILWYSRFEIYRLLGPARNLEEAWRIDYRKRKQTRQIARAPGAWKVMQKQWQWIERAEAWDMQQLAKMRQEFEVEAKQDKLERIRLLKAFRSKVIQSLPTLDPERVKFSEAFNAMRIVMEELRNEYDDRPTQRYELSEEEANAAIREGLALLAAREQDATLEFDPDGIDEEVFDF